jgi:hypothetical protein
MIIRIPKTEQYAVTLACGIHGYSVRFYTDEKADGLCFAEIDAPEDNAAILVYLGREIEIQVQREAEYIKTEDNLFDLFRIGK